MKHQIDNTIVVANHHNNIIVTDYYCIILLLLFRSTYFINVILFTAILLPQVEILIS